MTAPRSLAAALLVLASACSSRAPRPEAPSSPPDAARREPAVVVAPAPLRRLTNDQYLNALSDLFPGQHPALPTLPDDAIVAGFDNATEVQSPSDLRIARYESIANAFATGATADPAAVRSLVGCDWSDPSLADTCASHFVAAMGARVFRRPLDAVERARFEQRFSSWSKSTDFETAVRLTLTTWLQAPQFLYLTEPPASGDKAAEVDPVEPYAMASRLSFLLWQSIPDAELLEAAATDRLRTVEQLRGQAQRLLHDERARRVFWTFHRQWLGLDRILEEEHQVRTPEVDPAWSTASQSSALRESQLFVEHTLLAGGSLRDLLISPRAWLDGEMARLYGLPAPADPVAFAPVTLPEAERAGILTRVAFLAAHSHRGATSPPIRGNALQLRLLCLSPMPPPPGVDTSVPKRDPSNGPQTNRMLFEARTGMPACRTCHASLNGLGFGLEHYSASGAYQRSDQGLPVDATGQIQRTDVDQPYDGGIALSRILGSSRDVHACAVLQWVRFALGRTPTEAEQPMLKSLTDAFIANGGNVGALLVDLVTQPSFRLRPRGVTR